MVPIDQQKEHHAEEIVHNGNDGSFNRTLRVDYIDERIAELKSDDLARELKAAEDEGGGKPEYHADQHLTQHGDDTLRQAEFNRKLSLRHHGSQASAPQLAAG